MLQLKEEKHRLSGEYDFAAEDIDESIIPILVILDNISKDIIVSIELLNSRLKVIEKAIENAKPPIYCDKPKTALLVGIGKYGSISIAISLFLSVFWIGLVILKTNEKKYSHFENLGSLVEFDAKSGSYFIEKKHFKKVKNGVVLQK